MKIVNQPKIKIKNKKRGRYKELLRQKGRKTIKSKRDDLKNHQNNGKVTLLYDYTS